MKQAIIDALYDYAMMLPIKSEIGHTLIKAAQMLEGNDETPNA